MQALLVMQVSQVPSQTGPLSMVAVLVPTEQLVLFSQPSQA